MQTEKGKGFKWHGVDFTGPGGVNQLVGNCIFCDSHKFYVNTETNGWDCKKCGQHGYLGDFLYKVHEQYKDNLRQSPKKLRLLAKERGLPTEAFKGLGIGYDYNTQRYSIPIYSPSLRMTDLRMFSLGKKIMSTPGVKTGIFRIQNLVDPRYKDAVVYLCEGEWDAIALNWLLKTTGKKGLPVGVPGSNTFKDDWIKFFDKREVVVPYDHDQSGIDGEVKVASKLSGIVKSLRFLHWPAHYPTKYDLRDHIKRFAVKDGKPRKAYRLIHKWLREETRSKATHNPSGDVNKTATQPKVKLPPLSAERVLKEYKKWLFLPNIDPLKVMYGALIANKLTGEPIWLFLVAPPGGSKSELLMSLSGSDYIHALTSLTPHTLISGAHHAKGDDPSLLPQIDKKVLVIKDFTTILTMHYSIRDEIFGVLRDVYDGTTEKAFGNGLIRRYNVKFGVLAGVTPIIETFNIMHSSLGERFLKFRITGNWDSDSEEEKIRRALSNIGNEDNMKTGLREAAARYVDNIKIPKKLPLIGNKMTSQIVALSKFAARLRGVVDRDKFSDIVMYKPSSEIGTRIAKQLAKLGTGIAIFLEKHKIDWEVYKLMRRTALDTVPDRTEDIVRSIYQLAYGRDQFIPTQDIVNRTRLPQTTVFRLLADLNLLKIADKAADKGMKNSWRLSAKIRALIEEGRIYDIDKKK